MKKRMDDSSVPITVAFCEEEELREMLRNYKKPVVHATHLATFDDGRITVPIVMESRRLRRMKYRGWIGCHMPKPFWIFSGRNKDSKARMRRLLLAAEGRNQ